MSLEPNDGWIRPEDPTDVLPNELRQDARRRRTIVRVGGVVVAAIVIVLIVFVESANFFAKVWVYGEVYREFLK